MADNGSNSGPAPDLSPVRLLRNPLSIAGAMMATVTAVVFLVFFGADLLGVTESRNPYTGIVFFIALPALFVLSLLIIPAGVWMERRRRRQGRAPSMLRWPTVDFNDSRLRATMLAVVVLTPVNVAIVSLATYKGVEHMDKVEFCGQTCHEVMEPEFTAYQFGPHAHVACVNCHIGPGADWFVRSKLSGTRQVFAVLFNTHSRPIESPVHNLRPARETCEQCHWPSKFHGDKIETKYEYAEDEANTETKTVLRMHIGGVNAAGQPSGIHWHVAEQNVVEYIALDSARQQIGYVKWTDASGKTQEYYAEGVTEAQLVKGERRRMDCVDCHNRPSHIFARSADRAINEAIGGGFIAKDLPFIRREAAAVLKTEYPDRTAADTAIRNRLSEFYRGKYPELWSSRQPDIARSIDGVRALYDRNIFASMKLGWGHHPDNRGHMEFPGCFRCHDEAHKTREGLTIKQDCDSCHSIE